MTQAELELENLSLGPAMLALSEKGRLFVLNYVIARGNFTRAAEASGYGDENDPDPKHRHESCRRTGSRLMQDAKILSAIKEDAERRLNAGASIAAAEMVNLAQNSQDEKVRLKASQGVLALAGINPVSRHEHVHHVMTEAAVVAEIKKMAGQLGLDANRLLGYMPEEPLDAEFTPVVQEEW